MVIYVLTNAMEYDYRVENFQNFNKIGKMAPTQIHITQRQRQANILTIEEAIAMIDATNYPLYHVKSFSEAQTTYNITINEDLSKIISCSCVDWNQHKLPCKHIFLVVRVHNTISLPDLITQHERVQGNISRLPPPNPDNMQEHRNFLNKLKRIERGFRTLKDSPGFTDEVFGELTSLASSMESIMDRFDLRRSHIRQTF